VTRIAGIDLAAVPPQVAVPAVVAVLAAGAFFTGRLLTRLLRGWFPKSERDGDLAYHDLGRAAPRVAIPVALAIFSAGLLLVETDFAPFASHVRWLRATLTVLLVVSCAMALTRLAVAGVSEYAARRPALAPTSSVARMAVRIIIAILALLTGLQALGVPVTPLLTTLGIGSLAVALALQDTLANFFSGLYLLADRPVRPGDYIKLSEGDAEGYVDSIGWRASRLRTLKGNTVVVPNQKLSQTILTNYHLPQADMALTVQVTVPFEADADTVEKVLLDEVQRASRELPELLAREPSVRLTALSDSGLVFQCGVRARDFEAQGLAGHELRKRIVRRLRTEGIALAYPQQVVHEASRSERRRFDRPSSD
jgi:small-conductance mechanosensitive channel